MKVIEIEQGRPTLDELIHWAENEVIVLRKENGTVFALTQVNDFDVEIESLRANPEFMAFLKQLSEEEATISLQDLRQELGV